MDRRALILGVAFVVAAAGCGQRKVETGDLEAKLKDHLGRPAGVTPTAVDCPDDIEAEKGRRFDCAVTMPDGQERKVSVTLTDDEGGFAPGEFR